MEGEARRDDILELLRRQGTVRVGELSARYGVAAVTIHRDLSTLADHGLIERVRGGARALPEANEPVITDWSQRLEVDVQAKDEIARLARAEIEDGSTIFIDGSSTGFAVARALERDPPRSLTLVTNSPAIAYLSHLDHVHIVVAPGDVDQSIRAIKGTWTIEFIKGLSFSTAFLSAVGVTGEAGMVTTRRELAEVCAAAMARAARVVGLVAASKFDQPGLVTVAQPEDLDEIITDAGMPAEVAERYRRWGFPITIAPSTWESLA